MIKYSIVNQFFLFLQTKLLQACCIWNDFPIICLLKLKSFLSHSYKQSPIFLRSVRMTMTTHFANAFVSLGVNSRGELVPSHGASRRRLGDNHYCHAMITWKMFKNLHVSFRYLLITGSFIIICPLPWWSPWTYTLTSTMP
jgi:hypothetical protein